MSGRRNRKQPLVPSKRSDEVGPQAPRVAAIAASFEAEYFSGPVPPPSLLARYNDVVPNGAERILAMAERQSAHRESIEAQVIAGNISIQKQGNLRAFIISMTVILGGIYVMATGKSGWGFAAILTSLASIASVFVVAKIEQRKERADKASTLKDRRSR